MQVLGNTVSPGLTVLCCTHGDELFGLVVFEALKARVDQYPDLLLILCNEEAVRLGKREVDSNLNRVYPGRFDGDTEERLAHQITQLMINTRWLIDIHTTRSDLTLAPIISKFNPEVKRILACTEAVNIFRMPELTTATATIDQVAAGVGLEFGRQYAETADALSDVERVVDGLLGTAEFTPRARIIYSFSGTFPMSFVLPEGAKNFVGVEFEGETVVPFLIADGNYDDENHRGFYAGKSVKNFF